MMLREFRRVGHLPTLACAFLYFDVSFMVWVLMGPLANAIVPDLHLSAQEKALLVAVPLLGGAVLRLIMGVLADRMGARRTAILGMILTAIPLFLGWTWAKSFADLLVVGALLGVAGASFAAALPLASRWYPPEFQGLAMGIAGAGNSGTALATFLAPRLAESLGWHAVFGLALIPLLITLGLFSIYAQDSPNQPPPNPLITSLSVLKRLDTWRFCLFYGVTFGGFVGLASFLNIFFFEQYQLSPVQAGNYASLCVLAGSFLRPVGGHLADRLGGIRVLFVLYCGVGSALVGLSTLPPLAWAIVLLFAVMAMLGMGNGAVFQLLPHRFPTEIGNLTGIIGAAGGVGGFLLPNLLGGIRQATGNFGGGFLAFAIVGCLVCLGVLVRLSREARDTSLVLTAEPTESLEPMPEPELSG